MTIFTLVLYIAIAAVFLTLLTWFALKKRENFLMSYLQNFCGALFIFSGYVKAIDPMGTAFKMEQYFAEFYYTFEPTWFGFLSPLFPWMAENSIAVSVLMIVFEIVLGVMLILGSKPKLTSWLFLLLVVFFTFLTGFTYLTGYVPSGVNFFEFGKWEAWVETNMKVTDCGCFGDFLKLKPKISFFKDVFLLIPSIYFVLFYSNMHRLFTSNIRKAIIALATIGFTVFCVQNYAWDEPIFDFRPFKAGTDIRAQKVYEEEQSDIANKVTAYKMTNKASGDAVTLEINQYLKEYKKYPKEEWELEQIKGNPPFEPSKISDFSLSNAEGFDVTEEVLNDPNYFFVVLSYKLKALDKKETSTSTVTDTTFVYDTIAVAGMESLQVVKSVDTVITRQVTNEVTLFEEEFKDRFLKVINPVVEAAQSEGIKVVGLTAPNSPEVIDDFRHATQSAYPFYTADDLLIKTMQRSNPGLMLWKDGKIIQKWHIKKMPSFESIKADYIN